MAEEKAGDAMHRVRQITTGCIQSTIIELRRDSLFGI